MLAVDGNSDNARPFMWAFISSAMTILWQLILMKTIQVVKMTPRTQNSRQNYEASSLETY
jgi:hypothetical protein